MILEMKVQSQFETISEVENAKWLAEDGDYVEKDQIRDEVESKKMSFLSRKVYERLVSVKNQTAMLTTFNKVNMFSIFELRKRHKEVIEYVFDKAKNNFR